MQEKIILSLLEYIDLQKKINDLKIELSQLEDQKKQAEEKKKIKNIVNDKSLIKTNDRLQQMEEFNQKTEELYKKKLLEPNELSYDEIKGFIAETFKTINIDQIPDFDNLIRRKRRKEKGLLIKEKVSQLIVILVSVFLEIIILPFCVNVLSVVGITNLVGILWLFIAIFGSALNVLCCGFLLCMEADSKNTKLNENYEQFIYNYRIAMMTDNNFMKFLLEIRKNNLTEIAKEKNKLKKLLPAGSDSLDNQIEQINDSQKQSEELSKNKEILDDKIDNKKMELEKTIQKLDDVRGLILIEGSSLTDSKEDQDILERIKQVDDGLYNEIMSEKDMNNIPKVHNSKKEKGKSLVKRQNKKIV